MVGNPTLEGSPRKNESSLRTDLAVPQTLPAGSPPREIAGGRLVLSLPADAAERLRGAGPCGHDSAMPWNPQQYLRFTAQRGRPFQDLVARLSPDAGPGQTIVDLGCGDGSQTATLVDRWPQARIIGIDSSAEMLADAATEHPGVEFVHAAIEDYEPGPDVAALVSNAAFQWVPRHRELIRSWVPALSPAAWLGFQVPGNFDAPSHLLMREVAARPDYAETLASLVLDDSAVDAPAQYIDLIRTAALGAGREDPYVDAWETTYAQILPVGEGAHPVLEWTRGTTLVPVRQALSPEAYAAYEREYEAELWRAYPDRSGIVVYEFRRIFIVSRLG